MKKDKDTSRLFLIHRTFASPYFWKLSNKYNQHLILVITTTYMIIDVFDLFTIKQIPEILARHASEISTCYVS